MPSVIDMGHGLGVEFTHKTIGDALHALTWFETTLAHNGLQ